MEMPLTTPVFFAGGAQGEPAAVTTSSSFRLLFALEFVLSLTAMSKAEVLLLSGSSSGKAVKVLERVSASGSDIQCEVARQHHTSSGKPGVDPRAFVSTVLNLMQDGRAGLEDGCQQCLEESTKSRT
jgi:hypothetical protein